MDPKTAVKVYSFGDRAKSELIIASQLTIALPGFNKEEHPGGRRMLILLLEAVRSETEFAYRNTEVSEFRKATELLSEAISLVESAREGAAAQKISESISASTTAAQMAWQVLSDHGLL